MGGATVRISPETLVNQAEATGFRPDMLEKVGFCCNCSLPSAAILF